MIVGDGVGVPELLSRMPHNRVAAIVSAGNRPQYHKGLQVLARDMGVDFLIQPIFSDKVSYSQFISDVKRLSPDSLLSHSYSMLIRPDILKLVKGRAFNIHAALLPRNRGPNPVQWALIRGEDKTGVTLHLMDETIDSGNIIDQQEIEILVSDTWVTLMERVKSATHTLMDRALPKLIEGDWKERLQDSNQITLNQRISQESFQINFSAMTDVEIYNLIRAQVFPLAGVYLEGLEDKVRFPNLLTMSQVRALRQEHESNG